MRLISILIALARLKLGRALIQLGAELIEAGTGLLFGDFGGAGFRSRALVCSHCQGAVFCRANRLGS
jgi:hypothetical protein